MNLRRAILLSTLGALLAPACEDDTSCTLVGCGQTATITIEGNGGTALPDSSYEIVLELDGEPYVTACGSPEPGMFMCEPIEGAATYQVTATATTNGTIAIDINDQDGSGDGPQSMHLSVVAGDAPLVDLTQDFEYEESFPNGEGCGSCIQAEPVTAETPPV